MLDHPLLGVEEVDEARLFAKEHELGFHYWGVLDRSKNVSEVDNGVWHEAISGCEQRRPDERLHIRADGSVVLCCQDWRGEVVLGSLTSQSIEELWNGSAYEGIRRKIGCGIPGEAPDLCRKCAIAKPS